MRLEQVLQNLIQNALKYSRSGDPVDVRVDVLDSRAVLQVVDYGLGIPRDALPKIFDRFYRAPNAQHRQIAGIGIGLFVAREIVELHGGRVEVDSVEGKGSVFTVWLPRVPDAEARLSRTP